MNILVHEQVMERLNLTELIGQPYGSHRHYNVTSHYIFLANNNFSWTLISIFCGKKIPMGIGQSIWEHFLFIYFCVCVFGGWGVWAVWLCLAFRMKTCFYRWSCASRLNVHLPPDTLWTKPIYFVYLALHPHHIFVFLFFP